MEPAVEFMEYDRSNEYLESTIEPDEFGNAEYDNTIGEYIKNSLE